MSDLAAKGERENTHASSAVTTRSRQSVESILMRERGKKGGVEGGMGMREGAAEKRADLSKKRKCGGDEIITFLARIFVQNSKVSIKFPRKS